MTDIPSIVLGDVEDGGHVEASSEAVENKSLEEPRRVMREAATDHLSVTAGGARKRAPVEEEGFPQVLIVLLVKVVDDCCVVVCCDICSNEANHGRIVIPTIHALFDGVAADEAHGSVGELQNTVVEVVNGVVGLDVAAEGD